MEPTKLFIFKQCFIVSFLFQGEKSSSGHLEFSTLNEAVEALVICNHIPLSGASKIYRYLNSILIFIFISLSRCQMALHDKIVFLNAPSGPGGSSAMRTRLLIIIYDGPSKKDLSETIKKLKKTNLTRKKKTNLHFII